MTENSDFSEQSLRQAIELLFYAYRDFTAEPDAILAQSGFGRAHHRVIYFVGRNPGITVNGLLNILKITKQSLARVLRQLVDEGYIEQKKGAQDRRQRMLYLKDKGQGLEHMLTERQGRRIERAFSGKSPDAINGFKSILRGIINEQDRDRVTE